MIARLKQLVIEAHRRSLWQVLGVYVVSSWVVLQVADTLTGVFGLPHWVPQFALVLLIIGLPVVMATAVVQEGGRSPAPVTTDPGFLRRNLTWKRSLLGGVAAFAFLGLLAGGYLVGWAMGIGPMGSLVARGEIAEGEVIVLAEFSSPSGDPTVGATVTETLRIDLLESPILRVLEPVEVREVLRRMQVPVDAPLTADLAREVAVREGMQAYLGGEVSRLGAGYVLTANLRDAETERSLASFRETARNDDELIAALETLSRRIRERAGESLRSIHAAPRLETVTTASLPALRRYSEAVQAENRGDWSRASALLEEALELDPEFAMAWLRLYRVVGVLELDRGRELDSVTRAWELRHRLSERERFLAEALYQRRVQFDLEAEREAYHRLLELDPHDTEALEWLGVEYRQTANYDTAVELLRRAVNSPRASPLASSNLVSALLGQRRFDEAEDAVEAFADRHPENPFVHTLRFWVRFLQEDEIGARQALEPLLVDPDLSASARASAYELGARLALWGGRLEEAREHSEAAERMARQVEGSFFLLRRLFTAHAEAVVGDPDEALRLMRDAFREELVQALPPEDHWHFVQAIVYAMAGAPDEGAAWLRRFEEEVPAEFHRVFHVRNESARASVALAAGEPEEALRILEAVREQRRCRVCYAERMGEALRGVGRLEEAAEEWELYLQWQARRHALEWTVVQGLWVMQRIGSLYEELGDTERALHHYRRLAELWADADPELQPVVERARERIRALESGDASGTGT